MKKIPVRMISFPDYFIPFPVSRTGFEILEEVFQRLKENGLAIKLEKCKFGKRNVDYLGYEVSEHGIKPLRCKIAAIVDIKPKVSKGPSSLFGCIRLL